MSKTKTNSTKVALVTGASSGIGKEIAALFAKGGMRVILTARKTKRLNEAYEKIKQIASSSLCLPADLSDIREIKRLALQVKEKVKRLDVLVNVAGIYHNEEKAFYNIDFNKYTFSEILDTYNVGFTAPTLLSHQLISLMKKGGKIINISGTFENGAKGWLPYYASKKALEHLTLGLAQELEERGIQVNCISPSDTLTESYKKFFPKYANPKNCLDPRDIAKLAWFLASEEAEHINGQIIEIKKEAG